LNQSKLFWPSRGGYKPRLVRLYGQTTLPLDVPGRIQGWIGYCRNKPIGLNPECVYPLLFKEPGKEGLFWLTSLPEGTFIREVHHERNQSVVTFGEAHGKIRTGEVEAVLHKKCLRICGFDRDLVGPFETNQIVRLSVPSSGGLVFVWEESRMSGGLFHGNLAGNSGHTLRNGVPDYHGWCYNATIKASKETLGGLEYPCVSIGAGRYRGYAEDWVDLKAGEKSLLKFELGYPPAVDKNVRE